ncbi:MAG: FG-GAP repeat domain-containing protein [Thermoanaerobaculia bacterium]
MLSLSILTPVMAQTPVAPAPSKAEEIEGGTPSYIREETRAERAARVGAVDPGPNPDSKQVFERAGGKWRIERYERQWAAYDQEPGLVRPMAMANFAFPIYQQNEKYVWVWVPTAEEFNAVAQTPLEESQRSQFTPPQLAYLRRVAPEFTELNPKTSNKKVLFEDSSKGLPSQGSWRNSAAMADMNGDGHLDIIAPPERGARSMMPAIFLGDGNGSWTPWAAANWPYVVQYGSVVAADFNGDKIMDLAFGQHLTGPRVVIGDGKGVFRDSSEGLMADGIFPTRRVVAADVDGDGDQDLLAIYEGPGPGSRVRGSKVRAFINEGKGASWKITGAAAPGDLVSGDWLSVGRFNRDRYPDFVNGNQYFQRPETLYRSTGPGAWKLVDWQDGVLVPYLSTYSATATGRFSSRDLDDAIVSFQRSWPVSVEKDLVEHPPLSSIIGLDRISFSGKLPVRTPIMRFAGSRPISGMASGDFDRDGKLDVIFTRYEPREAVLLLGDGKGGFARAAVEGLELSGNPNYDLSVADVNRDGYPDVLVMYESNSESPFGGQNGSIRLFLNRGAAK